jgi:RNA polymerase sigma-70 factor, ECF subfamily
MESVTRRPRREVADEALIRSVFAAHGRAMLAYATRLTGDRGAAEDAVQEALMRAWRHPDSLVNGKGSLRGWLLTVVRNIITDRFRARMARPKEVSEPRVEVAVERDHSDKVIASIMVTDALELLSTEHRQVLEHVYLLGRTMNETAEVLGIPPGTVKSRSFYALRVLREAVAGRTP